MDRFKSFFRNIQQDLKVYIFVLGVICIYRAFFIAYMNGYISENTGLGDILLAMWAGFRISLKSAGICSLLTFLFCTIPNILFLNLRLERIRYGIACTYLTLLTLLFVARIPYYQEFHVVFNQNIYNAFKDDLYALVVTMIQEYHLFPLLFMVGVGTYFLCRLLSVFLNLPNMEFSYDGAKYKKIILKIGIIFFVPIFMVFMRFGGSFNYTYSINWENAGITKDSFLNEAILDDVQAMYRAYVTNKKMLQEGISGVKKDKILEFCQLTTKDSIQSDFLEDYFARKAEGARISKPRHIFIILGESYAQWPMLDKYSDLKVAEEIRKLAKSDNGIYIRSFMPNGTFTSMAVTGIITGLSDINIYPNYQAESYKSPYATAIAPQFSKLGYKTSFWYGGFPSWERIKDFSLAQGFDEFHSCADFNAPSENIWGTKDGNLFAALEEHLKQEEPTMHVVLTVTNHPPYNLDVKAEGFDADLVREALPIDERKNEELINELGHYWYMDKVIGEFVKRTSLEYPDSLFVITGDHADRMNISATPTMFERYSIPLVIYGNQIRKNLIGDNVAGSHTNILPTIMELIAPRNFVYYSIADSLIQGNKVGFNRDIWITESAIGRIDSQEFELLPGKKKGDLELERNFSIATIERMRTLSWWRLERGNDLKMRD